MLPAIANALTRETAFMLLTSIRSQTHHGSLDPVPDAASATCRLLPFCHFTMPDAKTFPKGRALEIGVGRSAFQNPDMPAEQPLQAWMPGAASAATSCRKASPQRNNTSISDNLHHYSQIL
jgi:hypothetical protein